MEDKMVLWRNFNIVTVTGRRVGFVESPLLLFMSLMRSLRRSIPGTDHQSPVECCRSGFLRDRVVVTVGRGNERVE